MLTLKTSEEFPDVEHKRITTRTGNNNYCDIIVKKHRIQFEDGSVFYIMANDKFANQILIALEEQSNIISELREKLYNSGLLYRSNIDNKNLNITKENEKLHKINMAKEEIKNMDPIVLNSLKKQYNENKSLGGSLAKYDTFFGCYLNYYM